MSRNVEIVRDYLHGRYATADVWELSKLSGTNHACPPSRP